MADLRETSISLLSSTSGVDLNAVAETSLYTVAIGKTCIVTHVVMRSFTDVCTDAATSVSFGLAGAPTEFRALQLLSTVATGGVGTNTDYVVIYLDQGTNDTPEACTLMFTSGTVFTIDCTVANTVAVTCTVDVFGYLF